METSKLFKFKVTNTESGEVREVTATELEGTNTMVDVILNDIKVWENPEELKVEVEALPVILEADKKQAKAIEAVLEEFIANQIGNVDMNRNRVHVGDILAEGHEDFAYIFEIDTNEKPVLVAWLGADTIERFTTDTLKEQDKQMKALVAEGKAPSFMENYYSRVAERVADIKLDQLCRVDDQKLYSDFLKSGYQSIPYEK